MKTVHAKTEMGDDLHVVAWGMTVNGWEYYITQMPDSDGIGYAYVQGVENEFGTFSMEELKPYLRSFVPVENISTDINSSAYLAPPMGGSWVDEVDPADD